MVTYPGRRPLDPALADALRRQRDVRPELEFDRLPGAFVSDHNSMRAVTVTRVTGHLGLKALIYKTPVHEDFDGDPEAYAAPISVADLRPRGGAMHESSLKNGTNEKDPAPVFHADPAQNSFEWTGVHSRASTPWDVPGDNPGHQNPGSTTVPEPWTVIDFRPFLKDTNGTFPIFRPVTDFYSAKTAMNGADGQAVNALRVPYGALSAALRNNGRVSLGDVGLAIRASNGTASGFLFADAGGPRSVAVGEYSVNLVRTLFGGSSTGEAVSFLVFPRTAAGNVARPELIPALVRAALIDLAEFANVEEIVTRLALPQSDEPLFVGRSFVPRSGFRRPISQALAEEDDTATANVRFILRQAGLP